MHSARFWNCTVQSFMCPPENASRSGHYECVVYLQVFLVWRIYGKYCDSTQRSGRHLTPSSKVTNSPYYKNLMGLQLRLKRDGYLQCAVRSFSNVTKVE